MLLWIGSTTWVIVLGLGSSLALFNEDSVRCKLCEHFPPKDANEFVTAVNLTFLIHFHSSERNSSLPWTEAPNSWLYHWEQLPGKCFVPLIFKSYFNRLAQTYISEMCIYHLLSHLFIPSGSFHGESTVCQAGGPAQGCRQTGNGSGDSGSNRKTEPVRYVWGIVSCDCGGWEDPKSAVCKLEAQENQWCNSVQRPENQGNPSPRAGEDEMKCRSSTVRQEKKANSLLLHLLSCSDPQWTGCPPTLGRVICFTEPTHSNVSLTWKHLHRHTQKWSLIWAPRPVKLINRINPHTEFSLHFTSWTLLVPFLSLGLPNLPSPLGRFCLFHSGPLECCFLRELLPNCYFSRDAELSLHISEKADLTLPAF